MNKNDRILILGGNGLVGSSLVRKFKEYDVFAPSSFEYNLVRQDDVAALFAGDEYDYVFMAAGLVGGIVRNNTYPADFMYENTMMGLNVLRACADYGVKRVVYYASSCMYPKFASQPLKESFLLTGTLEPTNRPYALSKISCSEYVLGLNKQYGVDGVVVIPCNLYGPNDNYDLNDSHVIPGMIRKIHEAKVNGDSEVVLWGTGSPLREFLYVDDLADASVCLVENYHGDLPVNVGSRTEIQILVLAKIIKEVVGFNGNVFFDQSKPDGTPRKIVDSGTINDLGWKPKVSLEEGLVRTYKNFLEGRGRNSGIS